MPIYEYECSNKHRFEVIQRFDEAPVTECTVCGAPVQKLPSSPAIQFKGSGWYITDYGRKSGGAGPTSEKSASAQSSNEKSESSSKDSSSKDSSSKDSSSESSSKDSSTKDSSSKDSSSSDK